MRSLRITDMPAVEELDEESDRQGSERFFCFAWTKRAATL